MTDTPTYAAWNEDGVERQALWRPENGGQPPRRIVIVDDSFTADSAFRLASQGGSMLWRGDFNNGRQLLNALARRIDQHRHKKKRNSPHAAPQSGLLPPEGAPFALGRPGGKDSPHAAPQSGLLPPEGAPFALGRPGGKEGPHAAPQSGLLPAALPAPQEAFNLHRLAQSQRARLLNSVLIELDENFHIALRRAPDVKEACVAALGTIAEPILLPLHVLQGIIGSFEWRTKGVALAALPERIHVHYGVFSPVRGEYIDLIAQAPLPPAAVAVDIGTGSGVLAAVLARRGIDKIIATDMDERALACARENISRLGLERQVEVRRTDMFPAGRYGLIVCNPPWIPARPTSSIENAIYDPDSRMLTGYLDGLAEHLEPQGEGWLVLSDLAEHLGLRAPDFLENAIRQAGLQVLGRSSAKPRHPKAMNESDPLHKARSAEVTTLWRLGRAS